MNNPSNKITLDRTADIILCLGQAFNSPKSVEEIILRTEKAIEIYRQNTTGRILFTGGFRTNKNMSEARFMSNYAVELGVPETNIILEEQSKSTVGNAFYCKTILEHEGIQSAIIVTSPYHIMRTKYIFHKIIPDVTFQYEKSGYDQGVVESIHTNMLETRMMIWLMTHDINSKENLTKLLK